MARGWVWDGTAEEEGMGCAGLMVHLKALLDCKFVLLVYELLVHLWENVDIKLTCTCAYQQLPCGVQGRREARSLSPGGEGQG